MTGHQLDLLSRRAPRPRSRISRQSDPDTSHEAAADITRSGRRDAQAERVLEAVRRWPGKTSRELAVLSVREGEDLGDLRHVFGRRLSELEGLHRVAKGPARACTASGKRAVTWRPV